MLLDGYGSSDGRCISISNLKIPCYDGDADSIGFVDVDEIKRLNKVRFLLLKAEEKFQFRRRTVAEISLPPMPTEKPRKGGFGAFRAWLDRRRDQSDKKNYCYSNPIDVYSQPKASVISSVQLPLSPPKKKRKTVARKLQIFLFCLPH